jgi:hypothetical protein
MQSIKPGKMSMISAGRRSGKSQLGSQAFQRLFDDLSQRPIEELKLTEGRIHGARYYCVQPVGGNWLEMEKWALRTYGKVGSVWHETKNGSLKPLHRWYMNDRKFWFRDQADQLMFVMKWR